jgi:hypothetical protein
MTSVRLNQLGNQKWVITVELRVGSFRLRVGRQLGKSFQKGGGQPEVSRQVRLYYRP